jgi:hypothetical protein
MKDTKKKILKRIGLIIGSLAVVAGIAAGTVFILSRAMPTKIAEQTAKTPQDLAKDTIKAATELESKGSTDAALAKYNEALTYFQQAGDKANELAAASHITYLENVKKAEEAALEARKSYDPYNPTTTPTPTAVDPTKVQGYGTSLGISTP